MADANFMTGSDGLIAINKVGNQVLFLDPNSYETVLTLDGFAPRVHEVLIAPDRGIAYVPIYGDGIHGKNPHPGHLIALFDLRARRHIGDWSTAPYLAPHGLRWGPLGQLYCVCENSGVVLEMEAALFGSQPEEALPRKATGGKRRAPSAVEVASTDNVETSHKGQTPSLPAVPTGGTGGRAFASDPLGRHGAASAGHHQEGWRCWRHVI